MKTTILKSAFPMQAVLIIIMLISVCSGCKKDKKKGCTDPDAKNYDMSAEENDGSCIYPVTTMQAKIDGILVVCDSMIQVDQDVYTIYGVSGKKSYGYFIKLQFPADFGVGNYPFLTFNSSSSFMNDAFVTSPGFNYHCFDGFATVTDFSEHNIKGIFSFNATDINTADTIHVTEGIFDIDYDY